MNVPNVLRKITAALRAAGVEYMLTGSFASAHYGALRSTMDIDIVIVAGRDQLQKLAQHLPAPEYYMELESAVEACERASMFNVIDLASGWKIDLIFRKPRAFSREEFSRRQPVDVEGVPIFIASAEDIVLAKLEWSKLAQSQRQIEDAVAILRLQWNNLDRSYLERWIADLNLEPEWRKARTDAGFLDGSAREV